MVALVSQAASPSLSVISLGFIFSRALRLSFVLLFTYMCVFHGSSLQDIRCMKAGTLSVWSTATSQVRRTGIGPRQVPEIRESMKTWERYSKEERNAFLHQEGNLATFCCKEPLVEEVSLLHPTPISLSTPNSENHRAGSGRGAFVAQCPSRVMVRTCRTWDYRSFARDVLCCFRISECCAYQ